MIVFKDGKIRKDELINNTRSAREELESLPEIGEDDEEDDE